MATKETLPCELTEYEVAERAKTLAELHAKQDKLEVEKKAVVDDFKGKLDHVERDMKILARQVRDRSEHRDVEVDERLDDIRFVIETFRLDTGEIIRSRPMTQDEKTEAMQASLPGIGKRRGRKSVEDRVIDAIDKAAADKIKKAIE